MTEIYVGGEEVPLPEFRPSNHPELIFRAHSTEGRHTILYLGGDSYWVDGIWMVQSGRHMIILRNRVFDVSELELGLIALEMLTASPEMSQVVH